jgi:hypothetical protein
MSSQWRLCNAHHLRELKALIDIEKEDWGASDGAPCCAARVAGRYMLPVVREGPNLGQATTLFCRLGPNPHQWAVIGARLLRP